MLIVLYRSIVKILDRCNVQTGLVTTFHDNGLSVCGVEIRNVQIIMS